MVNDQDLENIDVREPAVIKELRGRGDGSS